MRNGDARRIFLVLAVCMGAGFCVVANAQGQKEKEPPRTFTDDQGRKISASVVGIKGGNVELRMNPADEKTLLFPIGKLSEEDRAYLKQWFKDNGIFELRFREKEVRSPMADPAGRVGRGPARSRGRRPYGGDQKNVKMSWEKGHYELDIRNASVLDLKGAELVYRIQIKRTDYSDPVASKQVSSSTPHIFEGRRPLPDLPIGKSIKVATKPVELFSRKWEVDVFRTFTDSKGQSYTAKETSKFRIGHKLDGIDLKLMVGNRVVAEYKTEDRSAKKLSWGNAQAYSKSDFGIRKD